jgi:hypothetical protein
MCLAGSSMNTSGPPDTARQTLSRHLHGGDAGSRSEWLSGSGKPPRPPDRPRPDSDGCRAADVQFSRCPQQPLQFPRGWVVHQISANPAVGGHNRARAPFRCSQEGSRSRARGADLAAGTGKPSLGYLRICGKCAELGISGPRSDRFLHSATNQMPIRISREPGRLPMGSSSSLWPLGQRRSESPKPSGSPLLSQSLHTMTSNLPYLPLHAILTPRAGLPHQARQRR